MPKLAQPKHNPDPRASECGILPCECGRDTSSPRPGETVLLDEAIELQREALRLRPEGNPNRASSCEYLALSLTARFNETGDTLLLDEALVVQREALRLHPDGHPYRARSCGNLAVSLKACFNQTGNTVLLEEAIELEREALHLRPEGHPWRTASCGNLAGLLWARFNQTGDTALLDETLKLEREALRLRPEGHPDRALSCGNLATSLRTRFSQTGDMELLDEAQLLCTRAIEESSMSSYNEVLLRVELARIHLLPAYSSYSPSAAVTFLLETIQHRAGLLPHFYSIRDTLRLCVKVAVSHEDNARLLAVYQAIIQVLPELGSIVLDKTSRLHRWRDAGDIPLEALLLSLRASSLPLGLELLEQGTSGKARKLIWRFGCFGAFWFSSAFRKRAKADKSTQIRKSNK